MVAIFSISKQWRQRHLRFGGPMASTEREPIPGVWGQSPQRGPGSEPPVRVSGGQSPPEAESFTTFGRPTEAITFMPFTIFCRLSAPNFGYTISRQDLTKSDIWQIFSLPPHLKDNTALPCKYWRTHSCNLQYY